MMTILSLAAKLEEVTSQLETRYEKTEGLFLCVLRPAVERPEQSGGERSEASAGSALADRLEHTLDRLLEVDIRFESLNIRCDLDLAEEGTRCH